MLVDKAARGVRSTACSSTLGGILSFTAHSMKLERGARRLGKGRREVSVRSEKPEISLLKQCNQMSDIFSLFSGSDNMTLDCDHDLYA